MKKCPKCKEEIQDNAKVCKHCNADLRNWFLKHKVITGILVFIVVVGVASTSGQSGSKPSGGASGSTSGTSKEQQKTYAVGQDVPVGDFIYFVEGTEKRQSVGNQYVKREASGQPIRQKRSKWAISSGKVESKKLFKRTKNT